MKVSGSVVLQKQSLRHLALSGGFIAVGLLTFWLSGGFPATSWRLLFRLLAHFGTGWRERGAALLFPLAFLVIQSLCLVLAWCLLFLGSYYEGMAFYMQFRQRSRSASAPQSGPGQPLLPTAQQQGEASGSFTLASAPATLLLPQAAKFPAPKKQAASPEPQKQPEPKVIRRVVAKTLKSEFVLGNPFAGPGELPEVLREEEVLQKSAEQIEQETDPSGFKLGNPFEGPGALPEVLREEERLTNPYAEAEIEETVITPDGARSVTRVPISPQEEQADSLAQSEATQRLVPSSEAFTPTGQAHDEFYLPNPFEDEADTLSSQTPGLMQQIARPETAAPNKKEDDLLQNPFEEPSERTSFFSTSSMPDRSGATGTGGGFANAYTPEFARTVPPVQPAQEPEIFVEEERERLFKHQSVLTMKPLQASAVTHQGLKRIGRPNEDAHCVITTMRKLAPGKEVPVGLFLVADGMGGHTEGQYASTLVINGIQLALKDFLHDPAVDESQLKAHLDYAIQATNAELFRHNQGLKKLCGTTLTGGLLVGHADERGTHITAHIINIGDSRTYRYSKGTFTRVTRDHSVVEQLIEKQIIQPEMRYTDVRRNQVYRCMGQRASVEIDSFTLSLQSGDRLLCCSDGLWEMVRDPDLHRLLSSPVEDPAQITPPLLQAALNGGGEDNITAIVVCVP